MIEDLIEELNKKGISNGKLAIEMRVNTSTVGRWKRGIHYPSPATVIVLLAIARKHGIHLKEETEVTASNILMEKIKKLRGK